MTPVSRVGHAADRRHKTKQIYVRQAERFRRRHASGRPHHRGAERQIDKEETKRAARTQEEGLNCAWRECSRHVLLPTIDL